MAVHDQTPIEHRVLSVLVENRAGVLSHVVGLFSARGFNIDSLAVGETEDPTMSRITLVATGDQRTMEQIKKQLNKLINVLKIVELEPKQAVRRELLLVKVRTDDTTRRSVLETVELFNAKVVDIGPEALTIEITGSQEKLAAMIEMLSRYGIREMVQSGVVAMSRGARSMTQTAIRSVERTA